MALCLRLCKIINVGTPLANTTGVSDDGSDRGVWSVEIDRGVARSSLLISLHPYVLLVSWIDGELVMHMGCGAAEKNKQACRQGGGGLAVLSIQGCRCSTARTTRRADMRRRRRLLSASSIHD